MTIHPMAQNSSNKSNTGVPSLTGLYMSSYVTLLLIAAASTFIHSVGLLAIHLHKKKSNNNLILASLSGSEILVSVHRIIYEVTEESFLRGTPHFAALLHGPIEGTLFYVSAYAMCLIMYVLMFDRMICASTPLKYRSRMTRKRTALLLTFSWLLAIALGCITGVLPFEQRQWTNLFAITLGGIYIVFAIATYSLIVIRIRKALQQFEESAQQTRVPPTGSATVDMGRQRRPGSRRVSSRLGSKSGKEFLVPSILITSYIFLYVVPIAVNNFSFVAIMGESWRKIGNGIAKKRSESMSYCVMTVLPYVGVVIDGFTYIFLTKHYRRNIVWLINSLFAGNRNSLSGSSITDTSTVVSTV